MHIDTRTLDSGSIIEGDICIIGTGAAGLSIAQEWEGSGKKVILLEAGGFEFDQAIQDLYSGNSVGQKYYPLNSCRLHYFGGTTGIWGGYCSPMDEIDFRKRDWIEDSGWPIGLSDLKPFYDRAKSILDLHDTSYQLDFWKKQYPSYEELPFHSDAIVSKMWQFSPPTRFGKKYKDLVTESNNIHLYTYAVVSGIKADKDGGSIHEVEIKNHTQRAHTVRAKYFVLACGAIENARVLLASNDIHQNGLGNNHDNVGRYFMEHIEVKSAELWFKDILPVDLYLFSRDKTKARAEIGLSSSKQESKRILNATASFMSLPKARKIQPAIERWSVEKDGKMKRIKPSYWQKLKKTFNFEENNQPAIDYAYQLYTRMEQAPNRESRVFLSSESDKLGIPYANLDWKLSEIDKNSLREFYKVIGVELGIANLGRLKLLEFLCDEADNSWPEFTTPGNHRMGTTRMHSDPKKGVVDVNCKVHDIKNLFVAGASCFPTGGAVNSTFTLVALSLRLSDHIKSEMEA